jgi:hypothetical protein
MLLPVQAGKLGLGHLLNIRMILIYYSHGLTLISFNYYVLHYASTRNGYTNLKAETESVSEFCVSRKKPHRWQNLKTKLENRLKTIVLAPSYSKQISISAVSIIFCQQMERICLVLAHFWNFMQGSRTCALQQSEMRKGLGMSVSWVEYAYNQLGQCADYNFIFTKIWIRI